MPSSRAGRPRDEQIDERALEAALELLEERGFEGTTMRAVAQRSGLHGSALYRRWPTRVELIEDAIFPGFEQGAVTPTGDLRSDLRRFLRAYIATLQRPAAKAAIPGLLAHYQAVEARTVDEYLRTSSRPQFIDIIRAAGDAVDPDIDPDDAFDILLGAVLARTILWTVVARRRPLERTVDLLVRMLEPERAEVRRR